MGVTTALPVPSPFDINYVNKNPNTKKTVTNDAGGTTYTQQKVSGAKSPNLDLSAVPNISDYVAKGIIAANAPASTSAPTTSGSPAGPTPQETAAAQQAALVSSRRSDINSKLDTYNNLFNSLYGRIDSATADQANTTRTNYGTQKDSTIADYNAQVPAVDMSYYLSGVGDSSLRLGGLGKAETAEKNALSSIDTNENNDLATIGQAAATKKAGYQADQSNIDSVRNSIAQSTDPAELLQIQNDVATKIAGLQGDSAGFDTAAGYRGQIQQVAPVKDITPIKSTLDSLMSGAANQALKTKIASQIIDNSGVGDADKQKLYAQYVTGAATPPQA